MKILIFEIMKIFPIIVLYEIIYDCLFKILKFLKNTS